MYRLMTTVLNGLWTLGMLGSLAVGVQAVQGDKPSPQPGPQAAEPAIDETARLINENRRLKRQLVDAAAEVQEKAQAAQPQPEDGPKPMTYGPNGTFITLEEYYRLHPQASARYRTNTPRPRWRYRPPTCTPSRAQIAWAKMLPNHDGLAQRGLTDEQIVRYFAPSEVKALEGDEVPEHLRPDTRPAVVFINQRCLDGTCRTGYCETSRRNLECKDGRCPVPGR